MQVNEWETRSSQNVTSPAKEAVIVPASGVHTIDTTVVPALNAPRSPRKKTRGERVMASLIAIGRALTANPKMIIGISIVGFFVLVAFIGPLLVHGDPNHFSNDLFLAPSSAHWLGTSSKGEDIYGQLVLGTRETLWIGIVSTVGATILSILFGLSAGYFGGIVDDILSLVINVFLVLPSLPLAVVIASFSTFKGSNTLIFVLLFTTWAWGARVLRMQTLSIRHRDFVEAARAVGETPWRVIFMEILPNEIGIVASSFVSTFIYVVLSQVALEFLGLGNPAIASNWGVMLYWAQNDNALLTGGWWLFLPAGFCIALLGAGLAFLNYGIDEIANPRLHKERVRRQKKEVAA